MVEWSAQRSYVTAAGSAYAGSWPFEDVPLRASVRDYCGRQLLVDGELRTIRAIESYAKTTGPRRGELVSFLFD